MKVILIANVLKVGKVGDVINVKDGYARNFLVPQSQAIIYSKENYKYFEEKKAQFEADNFARIEEAKKLRDSILKLNILMIENASDEGRLYGSISTAIISNKINELLGNDDVKRAQIIIKKAIREVGLHSVTINLHPEVIFDAQVTVARTEEEAKALKEGILNKDKEEKKAKEEKKKEGESVEDTSSEEEKPSKKEVKPKKEKAVKADKKETSSKKKK